MVQQVRSLDSRVRLVALRALQSTAHSYSRAMEAENSRPEACLICGLGYCNPKTLWPVYSGSTAALASYAPRWCCSRPSASFRDRTNGTSAEGFDVINAQMGVSKNSGPQNGPQYAMTPIVRTPEKRSPFWKTPDQGRRRPNPADRRRCMLLYAKLPKGLN